LELETMIKRVLIAADRADESGVVSNETTYRRKVKSPLNPHFSDGLRFIVWPYVFALAVITNGIAGCAYNPHRINDSLEASPRQEKPWNPPKQVVEKQEVFMVKATEAEKKASQIPQEYLDNIQKLGLSDIIDIALLNSKQTRQAWAQARSAAAVLGSERGRYLPDINADASGIQQRNAAGGQGITVSSRTYSANASLSWLIFDFGGRKASVEATREALYAADWNHNAAIQNVILQVQQAYYDYFATKGLFDAQQASVKEAQINLNAAEDRHKSGVATIADVLQARTALSQSTLALETLHGRIMTARGVLATAMGLPANTSYDIDLPVDSPPTERTKKTVDEYLELALRERPDLAAARAQALEAAARVRAVRAQGYPSISFNGSLGKLYFDSSPRAVSTNSAIIGLSAPLFTGFSHQYDILAARAQQEAALANAQNVRDLVTLQVWTSYYNFETTDQLVSTSNDLMESAAQNHEVAVGRYKTGVGSILDLLTAQASLESARAQQIQARSSWWVALAQLAHDTGTLEATPSPDKGSVEKNDNKGEKK
jgi:outer membrane protein